MLEVGAGEGENCAYYAPAARVVTTEPDWPSVQAIGDDHPNLMLAQASAEELPFPDEAFDGVVGTLVFCTIPDAPRALTEVRRVLKPGGALRLVEHVRAPNPLLGTAMRLLNPWWHSWSGGCNIDRDTLSSVRAAGFEIRRVEKRWGGIYIGMDAYKPV